MQFCKILDVSNHTNDTVMCTGMLHAGAHTKTTKVQGVKICPHSGGTDVPTQIDY